MKNGVYNPGYQMSVVVTHPAAPDSGDPVRCGAMTGIALGDEGDGGNIATETTVNFGPFVADLSTAAIDDIGNNAIAVYDELYYVDADTPVLSKKTSGYFYGYALEVIGAGETATINVLHAQNSVSGLGGGGCNLPLHASQEITGPGAITVDGCGIYPVSAAGGAGGADDLDTITGAVMGEVYLLVCDLEADTITVTDLGGNIDLAGVAMTLDDPGDTLTLVKIPNGVSEQSRSGNA